MKIKIAWIGKTKEPAIEALSREYLKRLSRYVEVEGVVLKDEAALLRLARGEGSRGKHRLVLLESARPGRNARWSYLAAEPVAVLNAPAPGGDPARQVRPRPAPLPPPGDEYFSLRAG